MAAITRWEPFCEMRSLHNMLDRVMDDAFLGPEISEDEVTAYVPVDIYETGDEVVVESAMPGVRPEDLNISVDGDMLRIRGEIRQEHETNGGEDRSYHLREIRQRRFYRALRLPTMVDSEHAEAELKDGLLRLTLPKVEEAKPKSITVKAKK
jgi:HSP20 family protein